jgi:4-diphosphocytidyl-2-C-methyl-D-erythritol kinase
MEQFEESGPLLRVRAPAKINLSLLVAGKRPDGFHELKTIIAKIDWMDELVFEPGEREGIDLRCGGPCWAPEGEENLVYRACRMLYEHTGRTPQVRVTLIKNIPAGTGLGSASSDAAAALVGLNRFAGFGISGDILSDMAAKLGSDVAFFLDGPLALCTGRGEKIQKIDPPLDFAALLILPDISVSTKRVYENYRHDPAEFAVLDAKINAVLGKKSIDSLSKICANMLAKSCFQLHNQLKQLKSNIEELCQKEVCLSGSGSAMYMLFKRHEGIIGEYLSVISEQIGCRCRIVYNNRW